MLTLRELRLYRIAINFSTTLLLLLLLRMILVEPCCGSPQIAFATAASLCSSELSPVLSSVLIVNCQINTKESTVGSAGIMLELAMTECMELPSKTLK